MVRRSRLVELRTTLTGVDPGRIRLRLGGIAIASMALAVGVMAGVRTLTGEPVTVVLMSGVLSMVSNLAVNEPDIHRLRATTALMIGPALVAVAAGTFLAPYRIVADVVFVTVLVVAAYIRHYGPRGNALGMAAMMPYFFTQFLHASVDQMPFLLVAVVAGIGATLLLRGWVFVERPDRTVRLMVRAFRAHVHGLVEAVAELLRGGTRERDGALREVARRRTRLNETALMVADRLEQLREDGDADRSDAASGLGPEAFEIHLLDAELAAERLAVATRRLVHDERLATDEVRRPLLAGLRHLAAATATGATPATVDTRLHDARRSVEALVEETDGPGDRAQRVGFAVTRLSDALAIAGLGTTRRAALHAGETGTRGSPRVEPMESDAPADHPGPPEPAERPGWADPDSVVGPDSDGRSQDTEESAAGLRQSTRQAVQVGVATSCAIVLGEIISPARWYWAVIAAFVVFAGTTSRGDVLNRGSQRVAGTVGGVLAGMGLALVVGNRALPALILMFGCVFFALYLMRVSQALMAFWITAVLALLYGLIGQFSVETLLLRVEETAVGAALGMLAGYLVLPKGTREAFGEALDDIVDAADAVLAATVEALVGRPVAVGPVRLAREMNDLLGVLRQRARPLDNPLPRRRGRSSYQRALRVLTAVDHYTRRLARLSDVATAPGWAATLEPAARQVRDNLDGLRRLLSRRDGARVRSAEDVVDAAEAYAARVADHRSRIELLEVARLLRRIDQAVVGFAVDLGAEESSPRPERAPTERGHARGR